MLPFTSKLTYTGCIFLCSRSSPGVFTESQSQGPLYSTAIRLTVPAPPHRESEPLAKPNWHGNIVRGLLGVCEQIHRQQLGLSLKADANKYVMDLTEFLWWNMMNEKRGPSFPLKYWAEFAGCHLQKRHPLILSCSLQKPL